MIAVMAGRSKSPCPPRSEDAPDALWLSEQAAAATVEAAVRRYAEDRRGRIAAFAERRYSVGGALRLHRKALGWDLLRAPANLLLAAPHVLVQLSGAGVEKAGARRVGEWLRSRALMLETDVAREVEWAIYTELLELPFEQGSRRFERDALAETIVQTREVTDALAALGGEIARHGADADLRDKIAGSVAAYTGSRAAAAEIATALTGLGVGAAAFHQFTPSMLSLGPALAGAAAHQIAVGGFPLGAGLGSIWYGIFPVSPPAAMVAGVTGGVMAAAAVLAAFAGVLTDPVQRRLGLHQRRLRKLVDCLEEQMVAAGADGFRVRDHYVARLIDLFDALRTAWRIAHGH